MIYKNVTQYTDFLKLITSGIAVVTVASHPTGPGSNRSKT